MTRFARRLHLVEDLEREQAHRDAVAEKKVDLQAVGYPLFSPEEARGWAKSCNETPQRWAFGWEKCLRERWSEHNRGPFPYRIGQVAKAVQQHMEE